ncbi:MAG TPA: hypothetical protein VGO00_28290 [Kofleriaceae bacterium]|nr:hypothetical protein [Kofleriaceae bacterium]
MRRWLVTSLLMVAAGCTSNANDDDGSVTELDPGAPLGKEDSAGVSSLPVNGDYGSTQAWTVSNQWEDTDTTDARKAGIAWDANSGLNWDQKFSIWVGSFQQIPNIDGWFQTITISTPFGKSVPGPKIDCADLALLLRISFAAWYHLPIYFVGYDGNTPVYFGHFGVRTASGQWSHAPAFASYTDDSNETPAEYNAKWPQDVPLRTRGVSPGDELPFLGPGAREGAFLDEIHLNKRAARLVLFAQAYLGSHNMVDSRNMYNIVPEALRTGDVLMFARSPTVDGHTTIVTRVTQVAPGNVKAEAVYGNDPPAQPQWQDPGETRSLFTDNEGGGPVLNTPYGGTTLYSHLNGGLKRYRVAKAKNGKWMNTWMDADEASWINDTNYDRIGARIAQFAALLADPDPAVQRDQLVNVINEKRTYLQDHPASCAARTGREDAFTQLYALMSSSFGMDRATVDGQYRTSIEDYVFAPLDYSRSRTCCWNHTTHAMHDIIMAYIASQSASGCVDPAIFKLTANSYNPFASFASSSGQGAAWLDWSADESCPPANATDDVVLPDSGLTPWCSLPANQ